eukprot:TRINITY_DN2906_c3_g1_i1.p1 TRINITY_DN2906_c3_g1~~TRINITY_DN2906_c3_g1_i1.p1  ORF type:complete len:656 (-),score=224.97 TRINITY_DN2906_c3_g1_i1:617-2584(-)
MEVVSGDSNSSIPTVSETEGSQGELTAGSTSPDVHEAPTEQKLEKLFFLLNKTAAYSEFIAKRTKSFTLAQSQPVADHGDVLHSKKKRKLDESRTAAATIEQPALIQGELRPYQLEGVAWMTALYENGINGVLADEMGLGKTLQCIALIAHLVSHGVNGPFLVVCPLAVTDNWFNEFQRFAPSLKVVIYRGDPQQRADLRKGLGKLNGPGVHPVVISSYDIVLRDRAKFQHVLWKYLIVDEGQRIKNMNCKLIKELKMLHSANRLLLTGTPLQNSLCELWSMLNFLLPDIFDSLDQFTSWFDFDAAEDDFEHKMIMKEKQDGIVSKLHDVLRPFMLRRMKSDVEIALPPKKEKIIRTALSELQTEYYLAIHDNTLGHKLSKQAIKHMKTKGTTLANKMMQLRKVCNHPYLFDWPLGPDGLPDTTESFVRASGKLVLLDRLLPRLAADGHRVLLFSQFTETLDIVQDYLTLRGHRFYRIDGQVPQDERQKQIEAFNSSETPPDEVAFVFLASTRAGGVGINLTGADTVIFFDSDFNPMQDLQAQDRVHRIGQTRPVRIYRLATTQSIEERVLERAQAKLKLEHLCVRTGRLHGAHKAKSGANNDDKHWLAQAAQLMALETPSIAGKADEISDTELFDWDFGTPDAQQQPICWEQSD